MRIIGLAVAIAALAGGCDNVNVYYHVDINSYLDTGVNLIAPGTPFHVAEDPNADNLIFESQVRAKIEKLLVANGYRIADADSADYWLAFKYGADSGVRIDRTYNIYIPGQVVTTWVPGAFGGHVMSRQEPGRMEHVHDSDILFTQWLMLHVYERAAVVNASQKPKPLWIGEVVLVDEVSNLREYVDLMLVGGFDQWMEDTGGPVTTNVRTDHELVKFLRKP